MFIAVTIIAGSLVGLFDSLFVRKIKKCTAVMYVTIVDAVVANVFSLLTCEVLFKFINGGSVFPVNGHSSRFPYLYFAITLIVGIVWTFVIGIVDHRFIYEKDSCGTKKSMIIKIVSVLLVFFGAAAFTGTIWGKEVFGEIPPDQMLINLLSPTEGTSDTIMDSLWSGPVFQTISIVIIFMMFVFSGRELFFEYKDRKIKIFSSVMRKIASIILALAVCIGGCAYGVVRFELVKLVKMYVIESEFIEEHFVDPRTVKMHFPEKKRNLIHIYLESMENSYASIDMGGYMEENLIAPLTELAKEGVSFSHLDTGFGGPVSTTGCSWSVASMVNMNGGIPMKVTTGPNAYGSEGNFMPGAVMLGDILEAQGYEQTIMFGATAKFGGLDHFYKNHGNYNILDYDAAIEKGWIPDDYYVYWGFEDDKLYEYAKDEITRLAQTGKPFNFVMETADTHFPDGYVGPNTPTPRESQYANVIAYSASEAVKLVRWIQQQPFYENTTIVIIGDHNSMDTNFFVGFDQNYIRTTFNLFLNVPKEMTTNVSEKTTQNRWWANYDMFPTILASIGVKIEGEKLGLGTNMFSGVKTLFEEEGGEKGWKTVNSVFELKSTFYNENILEGDNQPFDNKNVSYY